VSCLGYFVGYAFFQTLLLAGLMGLREKVFLAAEPPNQVSQYYLLWLPNTPYWAALLARPYRDIPALMIL
jgi:hypothetical protein